MREESDGLLTVSKFQVGSGMHAKSYCNRVAESLWCPPAAGQQPLRDKREVGESGGNYVHESYLVLARIPCFCS